jgi:hypothetical protein
MFYDTSEWKLWPYVPAPLWLQMFQSVHDLSHPGTKKTVRLVVRCSLWPGIQKDSCTWSWACESCHHSKVSR